MKTFTPSFVGFLIVVGFAPGSFAQAPLSEADQVKSRQKISQDYLFAVTLENELRREVPARDVNV